MAHNRIECELENGEMTCEWDGREVKTEGVTVPTASHIKLVAEGEEGWNCERAAPRYNKVFCNAITPGSGEGSANVELIGD